MSLEDLALAVEAYAGRPAGTTRITVRHVEHSAHAQAIRRVLVVDRAGRTAALAAKVSGWADRVDNLGLVALAHEMRTAPALTGEDAKCLRHLPEAWTNGLGVCQCASCRANPAEAHHA